MTPYPIGLNLADCPVLVVGGGAVATRRATRLVDAGANITVVSPLVSDALGVLADNPEISLSVRHRCVAQADLTGMTLVICCVDDVAVDDEVLAWASEAEILASSAMANPSAGFTVPGVIRSENFTVGVHTHPPVPAAAGWLAALIAASVNGSLPSRLDEVLSIAAHIRAELVRSGVTPGAAVWHDALNAGIIEASSGASPDEVKERISACLSSS